MKVDIIVYRQTIKNKEDKEIKSYDLLDTNDFINGVNTVKVKGVNTFNRTNKALTESEFTVFNGELSDFNLKSDKLDSFNGIFHLLVICVTKTATYYNMYVATETPLGMVHHTVRANPIIKDNHTIDF